MDLTPPAERDWYLSTGAEHVHCPLGCEHPQERMYGGTMVCGRCMVMDGVLTEVLPCVPGVCEEATPIV